MLALVGLFLLLVIAIGVIHIGIRRYLKSDEFRVFLSEKASEAISVRGELKALQWDGLAVRSKGFEAQGDDQIRMLALDNLQTEIGLGGFWRGVWLLKGFEVREVDLEIDARAGVTPAFHKVHKDQKPEKKSGWLPRELEAQSLKIGRLSVKALLDSGPLTMKGVKVEAQPATGPKAYDVQMRGGELVMADKRVPVIRLDETDLRYRDGAVFITRGEASFWDRGRIDMTAEWDPEFDVRGAQGNVSGVSFSDLANDDWKRRLRGKLSTDFELTWIDGKPVASGHVKVRDGVVTALPILDVMEVYLNTTRFRVLTLNEAHADWCWSRGKWSLRNLVISSEGLMQLEGDLYVVGDKIEGNFRLGVAPGTLAAIPGAEEHVFLPGEKGFRWAPIRVTGTLSNPEHDLTERLFDAAGRRLIQNLPETTLKSLLIGKNVLDGSTRDAVQKAARLFSGEDPEGGINKAVDDTIKDLEEGVKGVIEGILGGGL